MQQFDNDIHRFNRDFDRSFARTEKTIKKVGIVTAILIFLQLAFCLALGAAIIYFIVYAITHWLRW